MTPPNGKRKNLKDPPEPKYPIPPTTRNTLTHQTAVGSKDETNKISVSVEFRIPKHTPAINIRQLFKYLLQKMFAVDITMWLLHWVHFKGNAITRSTDIPTDIKSLTPIFVGVEYQARSRLIRGIFKITARRTFKKIKYHTNIFVWLQDNHIWMRATSLKSSNNQRVGWMVDAHPTYTNYTYAADEHMHRLQHATTLKLTPRRLVWLREGMHPLILQ